MQMRRSMWVSSTSSQYENERFLQPVARQRLSLTCERGFNLIGPEILWCIKMDHGPARNLDVTVSLHNIELILRKSELKNPAKKKARILILYPFESSTGIFFGQIYQGVWKQPHLRLWD